MNGNKSGIGDWHGIHNIIYQWWEYADDKIPP